jgi:alcohol dehydrogenase
MKFASPFSFELSTAIEFGAGSINRLPEFVRRIGTKRPLIITDTGLTVLPWFTAIVDALRAEGCTAAVFDAVEPNPKDYNVDAAAAAARSHGADCLIAIGGGSPIDCAKAAAVTAVQGGRPRDYEDRSRIGDKVLPLLSVPTTAGTGSEVTFSSVITDSREKFKFTVKSPRLAPRFAVIDPVLTLSMPPGLTAATGMDALTHAIEAFSSQAAEPVSDACALYAAELIAANLSRAVENGSNLEARSAVLLGSLLAGLAFSHSDVGAVHCIAEALGGMYDIPHGVCNAVCLPFVMDYCKDASAQRYERLGRAMGVESATAFVRDLTQKVGLPDFRSFKVPPSDFPVIAEKSAANGSNKDNIPVLSKDDYLHILDKLQGGTVNSGGRTV